MSELEIQTWPIDRLKPFPNNARTHSDEQVAQVAASIKEWGWTTPVLVSPDGTIIAGHCRVRAAQSLSLENAPVIVADGWTEAQTRAYVLADNKLAENAGWDQKLLRIELSELAGIGFDIGLSGFGPEELAAMREWKVPEDKVPPAPKISTSKSGDIWTLGAHRLICGDIREQKVVERLMDNAVADMVWTDPPYNVDYRKGAISNDDLSDDKFYELLYLGFSNMFEVTKLGGCVYIAHADSEGINFRNAMANSGWLQKQCLIWVKNTVVLGRQDYNWKHEPILYGWKPGAAHYFINDFTQDTVIDDEVDIRKMKASELRDLVKNLRNAQPSSVIRENKPHKSELHPTMKPVELVARMIRNSSRDGEVVLDGFAGSGTSLIAATKVGRAARLVELDEHFTDVCVIRWQDFTGEQATLDGDGRTFEQVKSSRLDKVACEPV